MSRIILFWHLYLLFVVAVAVESPLRKKDRSDSGVDLINIDPNFQRQPSSSSIWEEKLPNLPIINAKFLVNATVDISRILASIQESYTLHVDLLKSMNDTSVPHYLKKITSWTSAWSFSRDGRVSFGISSGFMRAWKMFLKTSKRARLAVEILKDSGILFREDYEREMSMLQNQNVTKSLTLKRSQLACAEHMSVTQIIQNNVTDTAVMSMSIRLRNGKSQGFYNLSSVSRCNNCHNYGSQMGRIPTDIIGSSFSTNMNPSFYIYDSGLALANNYKIYYSDLLNGWSVIPFAKIHEQGECSNPNLCGFNH